MGKRRKISSFAIAALAALLAVGATSTAASAIEIAQEGVGVVRAVAIPPYEPQKVMPAVVQKRFGVDAGKWAYVSGVGASWLLRAETATLSNTDSKYVYDTYAAAAAAAPYVFEFDGIGHLLLYPKGGKQSGVTCFIMSATTESLGQDFSASGSPRILVVAAASGKDNPYCINSLEPGWNNGMPNFGMWTLKNGVPTYTIPKAQSGLGIDGYTVFQLVDGSGVGYTTRMYPGYAGVYPYDVVLGLTGGAGASILGTSTPAPPTQGTEPTVTCASYSTIAQGSGAKVGIRATAGSYALSKFIFQASALDPVSAETSSISPSQSVLKTFGEGSGTGLSYVTVSYVKPGSSQPYMIGSCPVTGLLHV